MKVLVSAVVLMAVLACAAAATEYTVGGDVGWTGPPNITAGFYDSWAANKAIKGGDSLRKQFVWNGTHNVAIVSKQEYDDCTKVTSYFAGGPAFMFTFPTSASGMYYFICTVDSHCAGGQKFAVNVTSGGVSSSPPGSGSPSVTITTLGSAASAMISLLALSMFS